MWEVDQLNRYAVTNRQTTGSLHSSTWSSTETLSTTSLSVVFGHLLRLSAAKLSYKTVVSFLRSSLLCNAMEVFKIA